MTIDKTEPFSAISSTFLWYGVVVRHGHGIVDDNLAGHDDDLLYEGLDEGPALGRWLSFTNSLMSWE